MLKLSFYNILFKIIVIFTYRLKTSIMNKDIKKLKNEDFKVVKNMDFKIGEKVEWKVGKMKVVGAVLEDKGNEVVVMTHTVNSRIQNREVTVNKKLVKLSINMEDKYFTNIKL